MQMIKCTRAGSITVKEWFDDLDAEASNESSIKKRLARVANRGATRQDIGER
jgi:hypothetical protein